jgi:phage gp36-like protein
MFLKKEDLKKSIYNYNLEQITDGDETVVDTALAAATEELRSYLSGNNKREWLDGRVLYDVDAILNAVDAERNALILSHGVVIAKWWIIDLCNADMIYEQAKERYDRTRKYMQDLADGTITLSSLPIIDQTISEEDTEESEVWKYGSRKKFNHE